MRFANVPAHPPKGEVSATGLLRRLIGLPASTPIVKPAPSHFPLPPAATRFDEPPCDLDQRVRLVGEW